MAYQPNPPKTHKFAPYGDHMISYKALRLEYFSKRKAIGKEFCAVAVDAEMAYENATKTAKTNATRDAAHDILKAKFRAANQARINALCALGPPPIMPT